MKSHVLILLGIVSAVLAQDGIFKYDHQRDHKIVEQLIVDEYPNIVSSSPFDPIFHDVALRRAVAQQQVKALQHIVTIDTKARYRAWVYLVHGVTVGYIVYHTHQPWLSLYKPTRGKIDQLAVCQQYRGQDIGKKLCEHALSDFDQQKLRYAQVMTTSEEVGVSFYHHRLGFQLYQSIPGNRIFDSYDYVWRKTLSAGKLPWSRVLSGLLRR